MRNILYVSGTRAEYGLMRNTLSAIKGHPGLKLDIVATGMHLMPEFGKTVNEIRKDNIPVHIIRAVYKGNDKRSMAGFIGDFTSKFARGIGRIAPDIILILGDRAEMLGAAITGSYMSIPVVHIHGGEVTSTVDETVRHAITKLSHFHLAATRQAAGRIKRMGEDAWRINVVGAPGLDNIVNGRFATSREGLPRRYDLDLSKPVILAIQHPVTMDVDNAGRQMKQTMEALKELGHQTIVIYPNADAGSRDIIGIIEKYRRYPFIRIFRSIPYGDYLGLMGLAGALVGNSSSGIIEAPSFHLPAVNVGARQQGRERAANVIDTGYDKNEIKSAIKKAIFDMNFRRRLMKDRNPYGDGRASERITKILKGLRINSRLLNKRISY
ncbi:MAG: UDP-N-acetylglucosamine 2-epimerase [Candidatus Omnitrophica bacterium]|nr:UDP-N-acetylglucosamine 2-epimerase [Candidatus Omnitrophota bacterium]